MVGKTDFNENPVVSLDLDSDLTKLCHLTLGNFLCQSIIFGFSLVSHCTKAIFLMHFQRPQCRNSKYYRWEPSLLHYNNLNLWIGGLKLKILYIMNRMHLHLHLQHLYLYSLSLNSPNHIRTMHGLQAPSLIGKKFGVCLVKIIRAIHTLRSLGAFYYTPTTYLSKVYH